MLASFAVTVVTGRAVNYLREQRRPAPRWRSWMRQTRHAPGKNRPRVHHFLPGIGIAFAAGGAAILTRHKGGEHWFSLPFGAGVALTSDEIDLLVELDNPYWGSESFALIQAAAAALAAAALAARFRHYGSTTD